MLLALEVQEVRTVLGFLIVGIVASAVAISAQGTPKPGEIIVIGCLQRAGQNALTLKDFRSGVSYRIEGDANSLDWHVGHQLEIHGTLASGATADAPRIRAGQVMYIAPKCAS
jgi:hypothetical protein